MTTKKAPRYAHIAARVFDTPLLIEHSKLTAILNVLGPRLGFDMESPRQAAMEDDDRLAPQDPFEHMEHLQTLGIELEPAGEGHFVGEGIAVLPVYGTLVQRSDWMSDVSGMMSYGRIERMMQAALDDPRVKELVWEFDTPGGEVAGAFDMADRIYAERERKPMTAVVNELAASAGYLLASAAGNVVVSRTASVGSIGVVAAHFDYSKAMEKRGVAVTFVYAGEEKVEGNPYQPLSPEAKAKWQEEIDETYLLFIETVSRNSGLSTDRVRGTKAAIFTGAKAVAAGLAARVNTFTNEANNAVLRAREGRSHSFIYMSAEKISTLGIREKTLTAWKISSTKENEMADQTQAAPAAAKPAAEPTAPAPAASAAAPAPAAAAPAANAADDRKRVGAILDCDEAKGREAMAKHIALETDMSVDQAKALLAKSPKASKLDDAMQGNQPGVKDEEVGTQGAATIDSPATIYAARAKVYENARTK